jgi:ubiquinone biosynthesis protein COQ4
MDAATETGKSAGWMNERRAIEIALNGSGLEKLRVSAGSLRRLLRDPDDTVEVFFLGIAVNAPRLPAFIGRIAADERGLRLLAERPTIDSRSVDWDRLRALPATTLGGAYARYLDDNRLDPDLFQPPPGLPPVPRWVAQRIRQTHDIWHVLTGYAPDVPGEIALQAFTYAQLRMPSAWLIAVFGTLFKAPGSARMVYDAFERGASAAFLPVVRFEDMWERDLEDVRRELGVRPATRRGRPS